MIAAGFIPVFAHRTRRNINYKLIGDLHEAALDRGSLDGESGGLIRTDQFLDAVTMLVAAKVFRSTSKCVTFKNVADSTYTIEPQWVLPEPKII